eukprot:jgi/Tetstr1/439863/TSEL_028274.t1
MRSSAYTVTKVFRTCSCEPNTFSLLLSIWRLQGAGVDEDVVVDAGVAPKALKSYAGRLSQFAEFCHDSENISPLEGAASAANAIGAPLSHIRYQGGWATNSDVVLDYIDPNVLPSPGAWFFFGHIAPLRHFQAQHDSAAVAFPVPPS